MRPRSAEPVNQERWVMSFAVLMTLLFAFFVVLYAMSQADLKKLKALQESMQQVFGEKDRVAPKTLEVPDPAAPPAVALQPGLQQARELLEETANLESGVASIAEKVELLSDDRGLIVRLSAKDFFDEGGVAARADLKPLLDRIGKVVAQTKYSVRIEGHADASEVDSLAGYPSAWELSAARASWVARYWINRFRLEPSRFSVAAHSIHRPLSDKQDKWSRGKNRRVEIILLKDNS